MNAVISCCCICSSTSYARFSQICSTSLVTLALALLLLGCQSGDTSAEQTTRFGTVETAIMGGYQSFDDTSVVLITRWGGGGFGLCSGSLIAPNVVLTAQHCIADTVNLQTGQSVEGVNCLTTGFNPPYQAFTMAITTRPYISQNYSDYYLVKEIVIPQDGQNGFCGRDVALLILADPVPQDEAVPLVPRVDEPLRAGETYSAIGYGHTGYDNDSGVRRRRDNLTLNCVGGQDCLFLPYDQEWLGETGVCSGDSGGPAIDEFGRVTGIASRGPAVCASPVYGSVHFWADLIRSTVARAADEAGLMKASWVTGWPTDPSFTVVWGETCTNGLACESGLCLGGHCSRRCSEAAACPSGYECVAVESGAAPVDGEYCSPIEIGGVCETDGDCAERCLDGLCTRGCSESLLCPTGFTCDDKLCRPAILGGPCDDSCTGGRCADGICSRTCNTDLPCPSGWSCESEICTLIETGAVCEDDTACLGGRCLDGLCTRYCDASAPCDGGWECDTSQQQCVLGSVGQICIDDTECGSGACVNEQCTRQCGLTAPCPAGYSCGDDGQCVSIPNTQIAEGCSAVLRQTKRQPLWLLCLLGLGLITLRRRRNFLC